MSWVFLFLLEEEQEPRRPLVQTISVRVTGRLAKVVLDDLYMFFNVRRFI